MAIDKTLRVVLPLSLKMFQNIALQKFKDNSGDKCWFTFYSLLSDQLIFLKIKSKHTHFLMYLLVYLIGHE